ncbi:hypothetical protein WJX73_009961 [Symbiochloris irregularis]|uniref:Uncharacterized protein n=1 Tax=Symbiochloris irregularis TaxID=706552 RepID=A0AAW1NT33_9CHLO
MICWAIAGKAEQTDFSKWVSTMNKDTEGTLESASLPVHSTEKADKDDLREVIIHPLSERASEHCPGLEASSLYDSAASDQSILRQAEDLWLSSCEMKQLLELHVLPHLSFKDLCRLSMVSAH